jgi:hypothetical protein
VRGVHRSLTPAGRPELQRAEAQGVLLDLNGEGGQAECMTACASLLLRPQRGGVVRMTIWRRTASTTAAAQDLELEGNGGGGGGAESSPISGGDGVCV